MAVHLTFHPIHIGICCLVLFRVTFLDERRKLSSLGRKRVGKFRQEPLITDHERLVRKPYFVESIKCVDVCLPQVTLGKLRS